MEKIGIICFLAGTGQKNFQKIKVAYSEKKEGNRFSPIPLGWIVRDKNDTADSFILEQMGLPVLRKLLSDETVNSFKDMYREIGRVPPEHPSHETNILLNMEVETGIDENEYSQPIWITRVRNDFLEHGKGPRPFSKNLFLKVWFEEPVFHESGHISRIHDKHHWVGNWVNQKGRSWGRTVSLSGLYGRNRKIIFERS